MDDYSWSRVSCSGSINGVWRKFKHSSRIQHSTPFALCALWLFNLGATMSLCNLLLFLPVCPALIKAEQKIPLQLILSGFTIYSIMCQSS